MSSNISNICHLDVANLILLRDVNQRNDLRGTAALRHIPYAADPLTINASPRPMVGLPHARDANICWKESSMAGGAPVEVNEGEVGNGEQAPREKSTQEERNVRARMRMNILQVVGDNHRQPQTEFSNLAVRVIRFKA